VIAENASPLFHAVPILYFAIMIVIAFIIPVFFTALPFHRIADVIVIAGLFSLARILLALAAMDIGTAFGSMGARREMLVSFLAEPALLMVFFNLALMSDSTALSTIALTINNQTFSLNPSLAFALLAFFMILLGENGRIPVDNPSTHLELTMLHQAMILEYSGPYLALIEWGSYLKLLNYYAIAIALFFAWGIHEIPSVIGFSLASLAFLIKIFVLSTGTTFFETITTKIRIYRVPEFMASAFLLAVLGVLIQLLPME
jgi:formate hydrogenlyase subunit 4